MRGNETTQKIKKCTNLSPLEADAMFFPGPGGKVNKAREYCSDCPLQNPCLLSAVDNNLDGFYAGTTKDERNEMAKFRDNVLDDLSSFVESLLPKKPILGRRIAKSKPLPEVHAWMDEVEPSDEELLLLA